MTTVINLGYLHVGSKRVIAKGSGEGGGGRLQIIGGPPRSIGGSIEGEHGLRETVAAAVITNFGDVVLCAAFGLTPRGGLSPFFMRSGERRKSDMLAVEVKQPFSCIRCLSNDTLHIRFNIQ